LKLQITIDGKTYAAEVEVLEEDESASPSGVAPDSAATQHTPPPGAYTPSRQSETHSADEKLYLSPVNGLVIAVNVAPGQQVQAGDVIVLLEAMKMETNIVAHHPGKVKSVGVKAGQSVKLQQALVELE
jgi:methylmalonyl-CoA carboxyltransferase small subunit